MSTGFKSKYKHIWYNPNKKRTPSGKKYEKAMKHYKILLRRIEIEWETKWLKNAMVKVQAKFKKYWIKESMIK